MTCSNDSESVPCGHCGRLLDMKLDRADLPEKVNLEKITVGPDIGHGYSVLCICRYYTISA